jgi:hypothetical protein
METLRSSEAPVIYQPIRPDVSDHMTLHYDYLWLNIRIYRHILLEVLRSEYQGTL